MESKGLHRADACSRESTVEYIVEQSKISLKSTKSNLEFTQRNYWSAQSNKVSKQSLYRVTWIYAEST